MRWRGGNRYGGIEDRRGTGGPGLGGFGMGGGGIGPVHIGGGGLGLVAILLLVYFLSGGDLSGLFGGGDENAIGQQQAGRLGTPSDEEGQFVDTILSSTTDVWKAQFAKMGRTYRAPASLVLYDRATGTGCGLGQSAMGPFYCPNDDRVYLDTHILPCRAFDPLRRAGRFRAGLRSRARSRPSCAAAAGHFGTGGSATNAPPAAKPMPTAIPWRWSFRPIAMPGCGQRTLPSS